MSAFADGLGGGDESEPAYIFFVSSRKNRPSGFW
jgi:hypothetical protein